MAAREVLIRASGGKVTDYLGCDIDYGASTDVSGRARVRDTRVVPPASPGVQPILSVRVSTSLEHCAPASLE